MFEACIAAGDGLTIAIMVATRNAAIEPVVPTTSQGHSLVDVFVYVPASEDSCGVDAQQRQSLAWKADFAARYVHGNFLSYTLF